MSTISKKTNEIIRSMAQFEKLILSSEGSLSFFKGFLCHENIELQKLDKYYTNDQTNILFLSYMHGYSYGRWVKRNDEELNV